MNKHEQLMLAGLGFVIGFTTAFIVFGFKDKPKEIHHPGEEWHESYGLVANASQADGSAIDDAIVTNDGLFAKLGEKERIVSAAALGPEARVAGFHYAVSKTLVSPDKQYLYYCALAEPVDVSCYHYVYSVADDSIYPVKNVNTDEYLRTQVESLDASWLSDGSLSVNGLVSVSADEPWLVQ